MALSPNCSFYLLGQLELATCTRSVESIPASQRGSLYLAFASNASKVILPQAFAVFCFPSYRLDYRMIGHDVIWLAWLSCSELVARSPIFIALSSQPEHFGFTVFVFLPVFAVRIFLRRLERSAWPWVTPVLKCYDLTTDILKLRNPLDKISPSPSKGENVVVLVDLPAAVSLAFLPRHCLA